VKVTASNPVDEETARHERILTSYLEKNPSHEGCKFVRKMLDSFEVPGEEGLTYV
jgi:serine/threonine-protein kinase SRPK3